MKRNHYNLIIAWASGADIEKRSDDGSWHYLEFPNFFAREEYRIKPKTVKKWQWAYKYDGTNSWNITNCHYTADGFDNRISYNQAVKLEFTEIEVQE